MRLLPATFVAAAAAALCACSGGEPQETNRAAPEVEVDVLPPDESVSTPTNDLATGVIDTPPRENAVAPNPATAIPATLHGRWGLVPADCTSEGGEEKGLVTISADTIRFYESLGTPARIHRSTVDSIHADFAMIGEGMSWTSPMLLSLQDGRLVRAEPKSRLRLVYTRC